MDYYFDIEKTIDDEFRYVFLCGSKYERSNPSNKRNVLKSFLQTIGNIKPIILENDYSPINNKKRFSYYDIQLADLYYIEILVNYFSDATIIIHESISTGAEIGTFLRNKNNRNKLCILVPDQVTVEEDKIGSFLKYSITGSVENKNSLNSETAVKIFPFFPEIEKHYISNTLNMWHTRFVNDRIGDSLGKELKSYLDDCCRKVSLLFTSKKSMAIEKEENYYSYDHRNKIVSITLQPRAFMTFLCALFAIKEYFSELRTYSSLNDIIASIYRKLQLVFVNTFQEMIHINCTDVKIDLFINEKDINIHSIIGLCIFLLNAARIITIAKDKDKIVLERKTNDNGSGFLIDRYGVLIKERRKVLII